MIEIPKENQVVFNIDRQKYQSITHPNTRPTIPGSLAISASSTRTGAMGRLPRPHRLARGCHESVTSAGWGRCFPAFSVAAMPLFLRAD